MPLVQGTKQFKFQQYAFTVDFGQGAVCVQKCSEIYACRGERMRVTIERGLSDDSLFAEMYAAEAARPAFVSGCWVSELRDPISIRQMNRKRDVLVTYTLQGARVVEHSVGPWNNEVSDFTMERLVIEYEGFARADTPAPIYTAGEPTDPRTKITMLGERRFASETDDTPAT